MDLRRPLLWLLPIAALSALAFATTQPSRMPVEPGLQAAKSGVVLDATTQRPLAGAYVVVRWLDETKVDGKLQGQCLSRAVVSTDGQGRYAVPETRFPIAARTSAERRYFWDAHAYMPGYAELPAQMRHPRALASAEPGVQALAPLALRPDRNGPEQRLAALTETLAQFACEPFAQDAGPAEEQIYAEAYATACLPEPNAAAAALARLRSARIPDAQPCAQERHASK